MLSEQNNDSGKIRLHEIDSFGNEIHHLRLHYVRLHDIEDKLTVKIDFKNGIKFNFNDVKRLYDRSSFGPFIYILDLNLKKDNSGQLYVLFNKSWKEIDQYRFEISRTFIKIGSITHNERGNETHTLTDCFQNKYNFFFDIQFSPTLTSPLPGVDASAFLNFCLFTCFVLHDQTYDIFNILIDQFQIYLSQTDYYFNKYNFNDIFENCNQYLPDAVFNSDNKFIAIQIILRMIGLLSIEKENFDRNNRYSNAFTNWIMLHVRKDFYMLYQSVDQTECLLIRNGLIKLMCIELLQKRSDDFNDNELDFLQRISDKNQRQDIANDLLDQLEKMNLSIVGNSHWTDLFTIVDPTKIKIEHLNLAISLKTFIKCIIKLSKVLTDHNNFVKKMTGYFEDRISQDYLPVDVENILFLLTFLEEKPVNNTVMAEDFLSAVRLVIKDSLVLKEKIKDYFDNLVVTGINMKQISQVFCYIHKYEFLTEINKQEVLRKSLKHCKSNECINWLQYFLAENQIWDQNDNILRKTWFQNWVRKCIRDHANMKFIFEAIDKLLQNFNDSINDDGFRTYFIKLVLTFCFSDENIYIIIERYLLDVQNDFFCTQFQEVFNEKCLSYLQPRSFKIIANNKNPLSVLIKLDKKTKFRSKLIHDLIQLICDKIVVNKDVILEDIFDKPTRLTFTYIVLFEDSFKDIFISVKTVEELFFMWEDWQKNGCQVAETQAWNRLNDEQRQVICDIWNRTGQILKKTISFKQFINESNRKVQTIIKTINNIISCINNYCQDACDKEFYLNLLWELTRKVYLDKVNAIELPEKLSKLHRFVDHLNAAASLYAWQNFLQKAKTIQQKLVVVATDSNKEKDIEKSSKRLSSHSKTDSIDEVCPQDTCLMILDNVTKIFDTFVDHLKFICDHTEQPLAPQLEKLFPDKCRIDHELNILKSLLFNNLIVKLEVLLEYWKNFERIDHIWKGCKHMMEKYNILTVDTLTVLQNKIELNDQTSGDDCIKIYEDYCSHYFNVYSESTLKLIIYWSSSRELLEFLYSSAATDIDDLLEVVNDWDETSINTGTVLNFVLLKRFFDKVNSTIKTIHPETSLTLTHIIRCFETILNDIEYKNILINFDSCSENLFSIQRICMGSKDKEQSKRKRILDIMQKAYLGFYVHRSENEFNHIKYEYDVSITINENNLKATHFSGLSELRDRARLIKHANTNSSNIQTYTDNDIEQLQLFISFVETIEVILKTLTELNRVGYPSLTDFLLPNKEFICQQRNYDELEQFKSNLETQLSNWDNELCIMYEKCIDLTYFSYQQMWIVENYLYNLTTATTANSDPGYHLLQFIGIKPQSIRLELLPSLSEDFRARLKNMAQILNTQHIHRTCSLKENKQMNKSIYLVQTSYKGLLRSILSLFNRNNIPVKANQLFYCTKNANWIEIRAFIYRCFYSQTLHQLIQPELLSLVIQDQFVQFLNQLIRQYPNHFFHLGIITTISPVHLHIVNGLKTDRLIQTIDDQELLNENVLKNMIEQLINDKCKLVTSRIAGLGKSTYIENEILRLGKQHIKFSISGDVDIDTLMERLRDEKIQSASSTIVIHINISPVENIQQLNNFLYSLILFRCFRLGKMAVDVPSDIPIYIELDSSAYLSNLTNEIIIFRYLKNKYIESMDWNELDINNTSGLQLVVNYLQAVEDRTINERDINEETITVLDKPTCIRFLQKYFLSNKNPEFISWTQLSIFISVYYKLFSGFSKCGYFFVDPDYLSSLRLDILKSLLNSSDQFTSLSVEKVRHNQRSIDDHQTPIPFSEAIIQWDTSEPFTIIFTIYDVPLFIYKTPANVPVSLKNAFLHYYRILYTNQTGTNRPQRSWFSFFQKKSSTNNLVQTASALKDPKQKLEEFLIDPNQMTHEQFFLRLTSLSTKYLTKKSICVKCFKQYEFTEYECSSCPTKEALIQPKDIEDFQRIIAMKLQSEYILTADNYIKMLLIYLRVQSNLPVLIMGETGCGKTALIQCLCQKILNDEMEVFHIHAGITNEIIIEKMHEFMKKAQKYLDENEKKRLWVFLDEFNTTPNIGLLKEIVCERTLLGESLPINMVLLGACNPQRRKANKEESDGSIGKRKDYEEFQRQTNTIDPSLLYSVMPIPETMLEHIWDYGYLDEATEKNYIKTILNACRQLTINHIWFDCIVNLVSESQKFFRTSEDVSSVSLRDVARFCRFYNWFYTQDTSFYNKNVNVLNSIDQYERSSLLALFLCYYFRLHSSEDRKDYMKTIEKSIKKIKPEISLSSLNILLENEKMALVNQMTLPPGTAKNRALTDNIFVLFTCIVNQIPVILCGKPGSSKTSAVQIVISNLRGANSKNSIFRTQRELIAVSYQGSHNCTSESIIKVFERADKYLTAQSEVHMLPVIVFDEIGLAEFSPHNPLKVLHSHLEIESCRYGFVGLSNWRLDASKMNRAVYLSCPDQDLEDLKLTAKSLSQSMVENDVQTIPINDSIIEGLANAYMKTCEYMKQHTNQYYFGLRDYYSLIKGIVHDILDKENKEEDLYKIIRYHLSYNFDGTIDSSQLIWSNFCEQMHQEHKIDQYTSPAFDQILSHTLLSRTGRFLMLIGDNESQFDYIQQCITLQHSSIQTRTLIGSTLSDDFLSNTTYTDQYNTRVLMDIILYAEKEITLFLRGLGHLYDNLYDLFNQNFAVSAKKKYCRIALGSLYHPRCVIHDSFYCVVFVKQQDLDQYDPPFLNRFEKHFIDIDSLIGERHKTIMSTLLQWIDEILPIKSNENVSRPKHLLSLFNKDYILNLVTEAFDQLQPSDNDNILRYCQDQILRISSFDLPLLLSLQSTSDHHLIEEYYKIHSNLSFSSFINQSLEQKKNPRLLIYTYTQIYHSIDYNDIQQSIEEIKLSHFKNELELIHKIKTHYQTKSRHLLFIRIDYHEDHQHISLLKHILINEQVFNESCGICLIFHLQRHKLNQTNNDVFFNGWSQVMIDNLQKHEIIPENILLNSSYIDLILHLDFFNLENTFDELFDRCLSKFRYIVTNKQFESKINERRDRIIQHLTLSSVKNHKSLRSLIKNNLLEMIKNIVCNPNESQLQDWREDLLTNEIIVGSCRSFNDALTTTVLFFLEKYLSLLLVYLEKHSMIDSYLFCVDSQHDIRAELSKIWFDCWTRIMKKINMTILSENDIEIPLVFDLHLPCARIEYEIIGQIRETIAQNRGNDEKDWTDFAYKQLISKSFYGSSIDKIMHNPGIFAHYNHDQLTLSRNEANVHQLSTLFIQRLTLKMSNTVKDQFTYLLVYYSELFEIMRLFEISIPVIGKEDDVSKVVLEQEIIMYNDNEEKIVQNNKDLYQLVIKKTQVYLIPPRLSMAAEHLYKRNADPFIETSLMNLIELLISQFVIESVNDIRKLIIVYSLFAQSMRRLTRYGRHQVANFEKFNSFLRLASCISSLFPDDKALIVFKQVYCYNGCCISFKKHDDIHNFIKYLKDVVYKQQSAANQRIIHPTLLTFENELLRNWSIDSSGKCHGILEFINRDDLWMHSAKILTHVDKSLQLSPTIRDAHGLISQDDDYDSISEDLCQLNDPMQKIEILMAMRIYTQLILDKNYQPQINERNVQQLIKILTSDFNDFEDNLNELKQIQQKQRLELISSIAWIRYYLLHYIYALKIYIKGDFMARIDKLLVEDTSSICSTIKLYIIKQLCHVDNITFHDFDNKYTQRNIVWINTIITRLPNQRSLNARHDVILPTPLFECYAEFKNIDEKLTSRINSDQFKELISECSTNQNATYCFLLWFIHYYTRFYKNNILPDDQFVRLIEHEVNTELINCFEPIGYQLIYSLCINFHKKSYFYLEPFMSEEDLHKRLIVLNIIALFISFKFSKSESLLFNKDRKMPQNYNEHFKKFDYLIGVTVANNPALIQMINIRTQLNNQPETKIDIFRCSSNCNWLFYFNNSDVSDEDKKCPLCKKEINISQNGDLLIINKPHIQMDINETLQFISEYNEKVNITDHVTQPLTYHFISLLTHSIFLFLNELNYISTSTTQICTYFRQCIETDYTSIRKRLSNVDQCYIWLYKLINHMMNKDFSITSKIGKHIEEKLILPHINSVISEIREYKLSYADFLYEDSKQNTFVNFVDELIQDDKKYPLLNFFNVTNIHSIDIIDHFYNKLQLQPDYEKSYPLTTFLLKRLPDYDNIQYLYPIIKFTNYLRQNFNHSIKRNDAIQTTISHFLRNNSDLTTLYEQFLDVWYKINLSEVHFDQIKYKFQRLESKSDFENKTNLSLFLLNKSNNNESMLPVACIQTIGTLQNKIVDYFHLHVVSSEEQDEKYHQNIIPIQSIDQKHLFNFDTDKIRKLLIEKGLMVNYIYGMGKDIIYDYDEIEWTFRNEISCLPWINIKNMRYFNYQFELYDENSSLINDIRQHFEQELLNDLERNEIKRIINSLDNDSIIQLSGSLEYILTYLRNINNKNIIQTSTLHEFIHEYIHSKVCIDNKILDEKPFSSIHLKYLIDLFELIEETIFDKIFANNMRHDLCEQSFPLEQRTLIVNQFIDMISNTNYFKDLNCWIDMFKRLLVRVLSFRNNINFNSPLHIYVKRADIWKGNIKKNDIQMIEINDDAKLKHAFIILKGLEIEQNEKMLIEKAQNAMKNSNEQENSTQTTNNSARSRRPVQRNRELIDRQDLRD